ncbi:MAG: ATP-dependent helicase [Candidatus Thiodiazotropha endolucinida]|nr:ATP-dependent helicase [Candidatus Thiodiazotropha endolucinida]MCW4342380.1 ATP-dependent helicase [Candidatus Thiodiazotropha endolucinida]
MIYGFNGSSKEYLCTYFVDDFCPQKFVLQENYRSTRAVIRAANRLKPNSQTETEYALEGVVHITEFESEEEEAESVASTIEHLLSLDKHDEIEGEISLDKMVVIGRNRFVFGRIEETLKAKGILFSLRKGERQLEPSTKFGKVLDYALRIKLNPRDWVDGRKLCHVLEIPVPEAWDEDTLIVLAKQISNLDGARWELLAKLIAAIDAFDVEEPNIRKFVRDFDGHLKALVENNRDFTDDDLEDVKLSLEELNEFNRSWTVFKRKGLGDSLVAFRNALALGQLTENSVDDGLTLSTVHTMKGLEKDIVFLVGMCEGVFPDYRAKTPKELDEERNNAFVAVTRAKRWLYVSYPKQRMMPWGDRKFQRQSRFVAEIQS